MPPWICLVVLVRLVAHDVDLAAEQIGHRRAGALVGDGNERRFDGAHEHHAAEMRGGTDAGIGDGHLVLVGLDVIDQALEVGRLEILARDDRHRHLGDEADIFEGVQRVIGELAVERGAGRHADMVQQHGVAVRIGTAPRGRHRAFRRRRRRFRR